MRPRELTREEKIARWTPLAHKSCRRFHSTGIERADMVQEALKTLVIAVDRYEPARGDFKSYAARAINNALVSMCGKQMRPVKVPAYLNQAAVRIKKVRKRLAELGENDPPIDKIAAMARTTPTRVKRADSAEWHRIDNDPDDFGVEQDDWDYRESLVEMALATLDSLDEEEQDILMRYFGLDGEQPQTYEQIGQATGRSKQGVHQRAIGALDKVREHFASKGWTASTIA